MTDCAYQTTPSAVAQRRSNERMRAKIAAETTPSREEQLEAALNEAVAVIADYLAYEHNGDPWKEDARAMGEMDINDYGRDGRLHRALALLGVTP